MSAGVGASSSATLSLRVSRPAWTSTLMARPWLDGSFGMATDWPSMPSMESWSFQNSASGTISVEPTTRRSLLEALLYSARYLMCWNLFTSSSPCASASLTGE